AESITDNGRLFTCRKHPLVNLHCLRKSPLKDVSVGKQIVSIRVSWIERHSGAEILFSLRPVITASIDIARKDKERRTVRKTGARSRKFFFSMNNVSVTAEVIISHRKMCFSCVRAKAECSSRCGFG